MSNWLMQHMQDVIRVGSANLNMESEMQPIAARIQFGIWNTNAVSMM